MHTLQAYKDRESPRRRRTACLEEREIDRVPHRLIAGVARMEVVARIVLAEELLWIAGIARGIVEIDDAVVALAVPNPLVERLALRFAGLGVIVRAPERCQRRAEDLQPSGVR